MVRTVLNKENKSIKIINSYEIQNKKRIIFKLKLLPLKQINRTLKSCVNEWIAHNRLYNLGLFKERTRDTDLEMNESRFRRVCYWIISMGIFKFLDRRDKDGYHQKIKKK